MSGASPIAGGNGQAPNQPAGSAANGQAPTSALTNNNTSALSGGQNGQAPTAPSPTTTTTTQQQDPYTPPSADEWKRAQQELAEARRDAAKVRTELKTRDDAALTAEQKRERDFADMQTRHLEATIENQRLKAQVAGFRYAQELGIVDIRAALALVQSEHAQELAFDEQTNEPKNLEELLKRVLKEHPILAGGQGQQQQGQQGQGQQQQRAPVQSGGAMNPGRGGAPTQQQAPNRPLRTFNDVTWSR